MVARSLLEPVPRPVSLSPYTIMVGTLTLGSSARASWVETGATGTQPSTYVVMVSSFLFNTQNYLLVLQIGPSD